MSLCQIFDNSHVNHVAQDWRIFLPRKWFVTIPSSFHTNWSWEQKTCRNFVTKTLKRKMVTTNYTDPDHLWSVVSSCSNPFNRLNGRTVTNGNPIQLYIGCQKKVNSPRFTSCILSEVSMNLFVQSSRSKQYTVDFLKMSSLNINKWIELPSFHGKPLLNSKGQKATSKTCHHCICPEVKGVMLSKPPPKKTRDMNLANPDKTIGKMRDISAWTPPPS